MFKSVASTYFDAVSLLRVGRFDESISLLRAALAAVQAAGREPTQAMGPTGTIVSVSVADCEDLCSRKFAMGNNTTYFDIFGRAFIFEEIQCLANTDENASLCAAVGLYNMALNMQYKGLRDGVSAYLRKASGLYQKVFDIVRLCNPSPDDTVSCLLLATVLNIIACESELRGHASIEEWKIVYNHLFEWATQTPCNAIGPEELQLFTSNAVLFASQLVCTAPAA